MPTPWLGNIKQTHRLTYYLDSLTGLWLSAVQDALREFNAISRRRRLGVTYVQTMNRPANSGGADLSIATGNGTVTFSYWGRHTTTINGQALGGSTMLLSRQGGPIEKAFIFLPNQPMINTPSGVRATGAGVMKVIAMHELIHGCGLHNSDHTAEDVFNGFPSADCGSSAAQDRVQITSGGQYRFMPPILFSIATARKIERLWR